MMATMESRIQTLWRIECDQPTVRAPHAKTTTGIELASSCAALPTAGSAIARRNVRIWFLLLNCADFIRIFRIALRGCFLQLNPSRPGAAKGRQRQPEPMSNGHWAVVRRRLARGFIERLLRRSRLREPEFANVSCTLRPVVADMNFAALERPVVADTGFTPEPP